jgi:hypothetical protein
VYHDLGWWLFLGMPFAVFAATYLFCGGGITRKADALAFGVPLVLYAAAFVWHNREFFAR